MGVAWALPDARVGHSVRQAPVETGTTWQPDHAAPHHACAVAGPCAVTTSSKAARHSSTVSCNEIAWGQAPEKRVVISALRRISPFTPRHAAAACLCSAMIFRRAMHSLSPAPMCSSDCHRRSLATTRCDGTLC